MENVIRFGAHEDLLGRDTIELPRFLARAFEEQVAKANAGAPEEEQVSLSDYLELHLAEHLSVSDVCLRCVRCGCVGDAIDRRN